MEIFLSVVFAILLIVVFFAFILLMGYFVSGVLKEVKASWKERKFEHEIKKLHDAFWSDYWKL